MIGNEGELRDARRRLGLLEAAFDTLREQLSQENPTLFPTVSVGYTHQIRHLREEIEEYLLSRPAEAPLRMRLYGPVAHEGRVPATVLGQVVMAFQDLLRREARILDKTVVRASADVELNLVATASGSFVLSMEVGVGPQGQRSLFPLVPLDTLGDRAVRRVLSRLRELKRPNADADEVRPLHRLAAILGAKGVHGFEFMYDHADQVEEASLTLSDKERLDRLMVYGAETDQRIRGTLVSLNIEENVCRIRPQRHRTVRCRYTELIEDDVIAAIGREVEVRGDIEQHAITGALTIHQITGIRMIVPEVPPEADDSPETSEPSRLHA